MKCLVQGYTKGLFRKKISIEFETLELIDAFDVGKEKGIKAGMSEKSIQVFYHIDIQAAGKNAKPQKNTMPDNVIDYISESVSKVHATYCPCPIEQYCVNFPGLSCSTIWKNYLTETYQGGGNG